MAKAVFLDRDNTLNPDPGYIDDPNLFSLFPWIPRQLKRLKDRGFLLIIITNQSGVGRGMIKPHALVKIHEKLNDQLKAAAGIEIDHIEICPHKPDESCECRKPKPTMILNAASQFNIDRKQSYMIGDRSSDFECGVNARLKKSFLVKPGDEPSFHSVVEEILSLDSSDI